MHRHPWRHLAFAGALIVATATVALLAGAVGIQSVGQATEFPRERFPPTERITPITDPTQRPRLTFEDLVYEGAFRLPADSSNGDSFASGGGPAAYNPARQSLFIGTRSGRIAEVSVPQPSKSTQIGELPSAGFLQGFADPAEGRIKDIAADGAALAGLLVHGGRLYGSGLIYYDANNTQELSHFARSLALDEKSAGRMVRVGPREKAGFVAGYMAPVPPEWQTRLGGPAITGQCCVPIVSRTSWGPAAFVFDPAQVGRGQNADAEPLLYYDSAHATLGPWDGSNPTYGGTIQMGGLALIDGTRTALFVGRNGTGPFCYGHGTSDRALDKTRGPDGVTLCYDPSSSDKGQHAYPYRFQLWAYDLAELADVRAGRRKPWDVKPYGVWPVDFPHPEPGVRIGGVAYDPEGRRLFIAQLHADRDGFAYRPLIQVFRIK